jgi:recombinational DNA repair ATPase RecF
MLRRVEITNFRSCKSLVLTDLKGVLALVGRNGAGKTNILRAIEWASKTAVSTQPSSADMIQLIFRAELPEVSLSFETSNGLFEYSVAKIQLANDAGRLQFSVGLNETLSRIVSGVPEAIFSRTKEKVTLHARNQDLAIGANTPALKVLLAILPEDDDLYALLRGCILF